MQFPHRGPSTSLRVSRCFEIPGLTIEQVGSAFGKSRATSARMLAAARQVLLDDIRTRLVGTIGVRVDEVDSLVDFVRSRLDL